MFLQWAHATNSHEKVTRAVADPAITAVECDVLLGIAKEGGLSLEKTPILAHPPNREGDCSVATLLNCMTLNEDKGRRFLKKHLKLDFKEIDVVEPSLELLKRSNLSNPLGRNIFLNADIFSGPGMRTEAHVRPDLFIEKCLLHIRSCKDNSLLYTFSLGYKCNWDCGEPYSKADVLRMIELTSRYQLMSEPEIGLVLALNARLLSLKPEVFDEFLGKFPRSTILAWTGTGEPSISQGKVETISDHFVTNGMKGRVDFDCIIQQ